jgi:hypothetical protein
MLRNTPAVISNFQQTWNISSNRILNSSSNEEANNINIIYDQFSSRFNHEIVKVSISEFGRFDGPEPSALWGLSEPEFDVLVRYELIYFIMIYIYFIIF